MSDRKGIKCLGGLNEIERSFGILWDGLGVESFCFLESVDFVGGRKKLIIFDFDASNNYSPRNNNKNVFSFYKIEKE